MDFSNIFRNMERSTPTTSYTTNPQRAGAFAAINQERDYQDARKGNSKRDNVEDNRDLGSLLLLMRTYMRKAEEGFSRPHPEGKQIALDQLRKVVSLGVLAMEKHGVVYRKEV